MKIPKTWVAVCATCSVIITSAKSFATSAKLEIDLGHPGHAIPSSFYGLMTEEINYGYDGGLFAELIRNRTFQDPPAGLTGNHVKPMIGAAPPHWSAVGAVGPYAARGFHGDYLVTVEAGGHRVEKAFTLAPGADVAELSVTLQ